MKKTNKELIELYEKGNFGSLDYNKYIYVDPENNYDMSIIVLDASKNITRLLREVEI